jgi:hypothetical protein
MQAQADASPPYFLPPYRCSSPPLAIFVKAHVLL